MNEPQEAPSSCALVVHPSLTVRKDIADCLKAENLETAEADSLEAVELISSQGFVSMVITVLEVVDGGLEDLLSLFRNGGQALETPFIVLCDERDLLRVPDEESIYSLELPYDRDELVALAVQIAPVPPAGGTVCDDSVVRVLAVEDSRTYLGMLSEALEAEGVEVLTATTGEDALKILSQESVHCILLDLTLPGISGQELCRRLRHNPRYRRTPIIMLTASEGSETMLAGLRAGADDFIAKSADLEVVRARLRVQLRRQRLEEEARQAKERAFYLEQRRKVDAILARHGERLRLAMDAAQLGGWEWDDERRKISYSGAFHQLFGLGQGSEEVSLRPVMRAIRREHRHRLRAFLEALESGEEAEAELQLIPAAGERWLQTRGRTNLGTNGDTRLFGVVADISVRKRREEEQRVLAELQSHLMAIVGHDLRSPLSAIVTAHSVLEAMLGETEREGKMLDIIKSSTDRAVRMIETLLDYSKARFGGGIPISLRSSSFHEPVAQVHHEMQVAHPDRELIFRREGDGTGEIDPDRISQVASNLLANALAHGDAHQPVEVTSEVGDRWLTLRVRNHGEAIPDEVLPTLFEPFHRGSGSGGSSGGLGLGLYIVRAIVEGHGGAVSVVSQPDTGTLFEVCLPRTRDRSNVDPAALDGDETAAVLQ
jgi:PAS domain S-box-containing protein